MQTSAPNTTDLRINNKSFLFVGMAAQIAYITAEFIGGYYTPGYSYIDNTASELMAIGATDRYFFAPFYCLHAILIGLFGAGLMKQYSYSNNPSLHKGGILLVILGVSYALASSIFPMDPPDTKYSMSGYMHIALISVGALSLLFSIPIITKGVYDQYDWNMFKMYTWIFLPILILCGIASPIILYTDIELMGLAERIIGHFSSLWLLTLSYGLMKQLSTEKILPINSPESEHSFDLINEIRNSSDTKPQVDVLHTRNN